MAAAAPRSIVDLYVGVGLPHLRKTFRTRTEAKRWERQQETRKDKGDRPTVDRRTLATYLTDWLRLKAEGAVSDRNGRQRVIGPRTLADYRRLVADWITTPKVPALAWFGATRLDRLTYDTLNKY